jgi:tryptophan synthase alpha chain
MNRIEAKFKELRRKKQKALVAFITAGYPSLSLTEKLVREFARAGVDIMELGVPFSDPMADGPVIQEASRAALRRGVNLRRILKSVKNIRRHTDIPICLMTYYNPIFCFGEERFAKSAALCGVDGVIIPDLPPEEGSSLLKSARKYNLDLICFISPTTSAQRVKYIARISRGFVYYVSLTGVTGARKKLPAGLTRHIREVKRRTAKPVCVGFGISTPGQVKELSGVADGVIVGSAIVRKIQDNIGRPDLVQRVVKFVAGLKG